MKMKTPFTPRHLRRGAIDKSGSQDATKSRAFRRAAQWSKRFIHQSASALESPKLANDYKKWCDATRPGAGIRKGG